MGTAVSVFVAVVLLTACGGSSRASNDDSAPVSATVELTEAETAWCADNPFEHGEAAKALGIRVVGDYVRESATARGPALTGLEPPVLAIPGDGREPLTYKVLFESQQDSDRACRAAFDGR